MQVVLAVNALIRVRRFVQASRACPIASVHVRAARSQLLGRKQLHCARLVSRVCTIRTRWHTAEAEDSRSLDAAKSAPMSAGTESKAHAEMIIEPVRPMKVGPIHYQGCFSFSSHTMFSLESCKCFIEK